MQIDAYSQRLNPNFDSYPFDTPRNMGKNDLWIASAAAFLGYNSYLRMLIMITFRICFLKLIKSSLLTFCHAFNYKTTCCRNLVGMV